jgi:hypothetical protein
MRTSGGSDLAGRTLSVAGEFRDQNPRRPHTHGWVAFEILRRAEGGTLRFETYADRLFDPDPEILTLAARVRGQANAFQDLKHIRCDIYRGAVKVSPPLDEEWYATERCSPGSRPHAHPEIF